MRMRIKSPQDFWSGVLFGGLGLSAAIYAATQYQIGTAVRMGPAYFPIWVGGLLAILGAVLVARSLAYSGPPRPPIYWRPTLAIAAASIAYGYLLKPLGLVIATVFLVLASAAGGHEFRWR